MTYKDTIRYLESFINYEKFSLWPYKESLKLERIKGFLRFIDNPQDTLNCLHIAGSKGKGSTCAFISYILRAAGYRVGLYTSPHLSDFRERIRILQLSSNPKERSPEFEGMISKRELSELVERMKPAIDEYNKNSRYGGLSFFEVYTALALVYFKEKKVDFAVLETGIGGRLDATNVVDSLVSVITPVSFEHTQKLGNTLAEIAAEKAGIIKKDVRWGNSGYHFVLRGARIKKRRPMVITAPQEKEAMAVIGKKCKETGAKLYEVGRDVVYKEEKGGFGVKGIFSRYPGLKIRLIGRHQVVNAAVAAAAVEALRLYGVNIGVDSLRRGLYNTLWPGRCEVVSKRPLVILDGAQNTASAEVLRYQVRRNFSYKKITLILGISKDKDIKGICARLCGWVDKIILTRADNPRAADVNLIEKVIIGLDSGRAARIFKSGSVRQAVDLALGSIEKQDLVLITGSLFVVGEARELFLKREFK